MSGMQQASAGELRDLNESEAKLGELAASCGEQQTQHRRAAADLDCSILLRRVEDQTKLARRPTKRRAALKTRNGTPDRPTSREKKQSRASPSELEGSSEKQQITFAVPTVSVATYDEDANLVRPSAELARRRSGRKLTREDAGELPGRADHDAQSASSDAGVSTTSEVNSQDGAESIASRLSQIVDEQEFLMSQACDASRASGGKPATDTGLKTTSLRPQANRNKSNEVHSPRDDLDAGVNEHLSGLSLEARLSQSLAKQLRNRTKSFAGLGPDSEATSARKLAERRNESSGAICLGGCAQFNPERGDLRALKQSNAAERQNSFQRSSSSNELMLNIRRSAWKLDEFEQAFKPPEPPEIELTSDFSAMGSDLDSGADLDKRAPFERQSPTTSSRKSFLARASKRFALGKQRSSNLEGAQQVAAKSPISCLLLDGEKRRLSQSEVSSNWQYQQHLQLQNQIQQAGLNSKSLLGFNSSLKLEQRRHSGISMVSLASSFDSTRTSRRPFGRLGSLLTGSSQRHRHAHGHEEDEAATSGCGCSRASFAQYLPVLEWLPAYKWRRDFLADLTAGLVVAVLNISTSLSAAVVAETDLGVAFRSSIFNTFVYAILCSSRHSSFGSWSIMSQMLLDSVRRALGDELILSRINLGPQATWNAEEYETWHMNIIIMYTFLIGLVQLLAGLLNLGNILASFIPEALCSSMIAATAFTMAVGQLANMCGTSNKVLWAIEKNTTELAWADLKQPVSITDLFSGLFRWIQQIALLAKHHDQINLVACLISTATVILLFVNQSYLQKKLRVWFKKDNLFIPFEMVLLIAWICVAYALELRDKYHVATCGPIFIEFNLPNVPNLRLVRELWLDSLATALISYTMVFIMAKTYSNKFNYEINGNQELIACGAGNLIGGLFDALPATASFSRTAGQVEAGGRTQMASIVNCVTLVVLAQTLGHHVSHLPVCVMSATLFFGFVRMMTRTQEALIYWRLCKVDFVIWFFTFGAILTFDLVSGFVYGFIFSLLTMLYRAQSRRCYMLGSIGSSDVYVPLPKYPLAHELDGIKIFQFCGPIHYVCADLFEKLLRQKTRVNVKELLKQIEEQRKQADSDLSAANAETGTIKSISKSETEVGSKAAPFNPRDMNLPTHIILDFSMISNLDTAGIRIIKKIIVDYQRVNITIMLASLASHVAQMVKSDPTLWEAHKDRFYLTLADAVHHALRDNRPPGPAGNKMG